jgi:death-on-curing protein
MKEPKFLTLDEILFLHKKQIERFGGSHGVRDMGLLDSAISSPSATFSGVFLYTNLFEMAAAYLFHLVMNHPFIDGNKRIGGLAADVFLTTNGYDLIADQKEFEKLILETAQGHVDKHQITLFLKTHSRKLKPS